VQSSSHIITTNKPTSSFITGQMPFLSPNQQCQSTEGKISHSMDLLTPNSSGGLPILSLTSNNSWLPAGRVAMPLISPLMPVTLYTIKHALPFIIPKQQACLRNGRSSLNVLHSSCNSCSTNITTAKLQQTAIEYLASTGHRKQVTLNFSRANAQTFMCL